MKKFISLAMMLSFSLPICPLKAAGNGSENSDLLKKISDQLKNGTRTKYQLQEFIDGRNPFELVSLKKLSIRDKYDLSTEESLPSENFQSNISGRELKNFDSQGSGSKLIRFELIKFDGPNLLYTESILETFEHHGLRAANLKELIAFMSEYSKNPDAGISRIVALGSTDNSKSYSVFPIAMPHGISYGRTWNLGDYAPLGSTSWWRVVHYQFLAVRK